MDCVRIPLTRGYEAIVDDVDAARDSRRTVYAWTRINGKYTKLHRFILNADAAVIIDHRDGNGLNNRRSNLRVATNAQNLQNQYNPRGSSRFKGVSLHRASGKWRVNISANGKAYRFGLFEKELDAAKEYNRRAIELHGEFARINPIEAT